MKNEEIERGIISTYKSIISILKNRPGMTIEEVFRRSDVKELESEKEYLETFFNDTEQS